MKEVKVVMLEDNKTSGWREGDEGVVKECLVVNDEPKAIVLLWRIQRLVAVKLSAFRVTGEREC